MEEREWQALLSEKAAQLWGRGCRVCSLKRVLGGAQKHTYLAETEGCAPFIVYRWGEDTSYFSSGKKGAVFSSSGASLFVQNNRLLRRLGVQTPELYCLDGGDGEQPWAYALVQYIDGPDMDEIAAKDPSRLPAVFASLRGSARRLHRCRGSQVGQLGNLQPPGFDVIAHTRREGEGSLSRLARADGENWALYAQIARQLADLAAAAAPRDEYTFIHGEWGPNHVLVDRTDTAYLIDIEGARFCDLEMEASFLRLRFGEDYRQLVEEPLDPVRMGFYHLCHCATLLDGAVELRAKGYYDMAEVEGMIDHFTHLLQRATGK